MQDGQKSKELVDAFGELISRWRWDLFVTLTLRAKFPITKRYLRTQWRRFITRINAEHQTDVTWVRSTEFGKEQEIPHIHTLIGGTAISPREIPRLWHPRTGNAKAEKYDPDRRAAWYLAKDPEAVEFSSNLLAPKDC